MEIEKSVIDRINTLKDLPSLPHILVKLMEACHDESGSIGDIADILTNDPSLCTKVLRLVNSAYYGLGSRVESIDQAVAFLGTNAVKNIAICSSVYQAFSSRKGSNAFNLKIFWWHSLKCALLARIFAKEISFGSPDEAFVAGLLHDIGKLVLWVNFSDKYTELIKKYENLPEMLAAGERQLGATHSQIGAWLMDRWKFPSFVADSALYHHEPLEGIAHALPLVQIVFTANKLSGQTADGRGDGIKAAEALYGFSQEQVIGFLARSDEELSEVARSFGIEIEAPQESGEQLSGTDQETQENLTREIRDISLLTGTIRNLVGAQEEKDILKVLHEGLQILFDVKHLLFFLYDDEKQRLVGKEIEDHHPALGIRDLIIPIGMEKSLLVSCLMRGRTLDSFSLDHRPDLVITDAQIVRFLSTEGMLCLPLTVRSEYVGVIVVGLDRTNLSHLKKHFKLLEMFCSEAAMALRVEQLKEIEDHHPALRIRDLIIPIGMEKSLLVSCLMRGRTLDSFSLDHRPDLVITDAQIVRFLRTEGMLCLPLTVRSEYVGVIVVGLDRTNLSHLKKHFKLLEMFCSEAAMALRVEQLKERQLRRIQSERASASFAIARKVVHEVNNPLGIMKNYLKILGIKLKDQAIEPDEIRIINEEIDRIILILGGLTSVAEKKSHRLTPVNINVLLSDLVKLTAESLMKKRKVAVHADLDPALPKLLSDRDSLKQIFINLMNNAAEAMSKGGNLYFKTRHRGKPFEATETKGFVEVTVSDDGPGIPEEIKRSIFEPFVSSKGGAHSGLGLSIVLNLINGLNGSILCQSEEGRGTRFQIELPVVT